MNPSTEHRPEPLPEPPHPFRTPAWIDPRVEHLPCQCPTCRPRPRVKGRIPLGLRITAAVAGGVVLPIVSLILNESINVVNLEVFGTVGLIFTVLSCLAHVIFSPQRQQPGTKELSHHPPRSPLLQVALLGSALLSTLYWGYLALLFIPLLPLSVIGIAVMGIGLCGLCPYGALFIALRQSIRGARALRRPTWVLAGLVSCILLPILLGAALGISSTVQHRRVKQQIQRISKLEPYSAARMALIQELAGQEELLIESYLRDVDHGRRVVMAEAYLRLTDRTLNEQVGWRGRNRNQRMINPWWFLQGVAPIKDPAKLWRM